MANLIQIKRSLTTSTPTSLTNGELAYTANGDVLFIGSNSAVVPIGGARNPGVLTANQALVANSTSGIDKVVVANLVPTKIYANGSHGTAGQVLVTDGANVYWGTGTSGSNTQVQFNDSGVANASAGFTFDKTTNTLFIGNTVNVGSSIVVGGVSLNSTSYPGTSNLTLYVVANSGIVSNSSGVFANVDNSTLELSGGAIRVKDDGIALGTKTTGNYVASINVGDGLSGAVAGEGAAANISVIANSGIIANSSGVFVNGNTGVTVNSAGVFIGQPVGITDNVTFNDVTINGNTAIGNSTTDVVSVTARVNTNIVPVTNSTYDLGTSALRWGKVHAQNVHATTGYFEGSVEVGGDIIVAGNLVTVNVSSVIVSDPMIYLAGNNYTSDLVDIGFVGNYYDGVLQRHTGFVRHAATDQFYAFKNYDEEPTLNTINIADPSFVLAEINAYLISGGLVSNSTTVSIAANSTVNVNIIANTISLSSPLLGNSGGTGLSSYTAEDILIANSSNGFRKLSLGSDGYVLQSNGTAVVYATLDGGVF